MHHTNISAIPSAVAAELSNIGARINFPECIEFKGYWAVDFVLEHRYRISYSNYELVIEQMTPAMQSGHQVDWHTIIEKSVDSKANVIAEAVALLSAVKQSCM